MLDSLSCARLSAVLAAIALWGCQTPGNLQVLPSLPLSAGSPQAEATATAISPASCFKSCRPQDLAICREMATEGDLQAQMRLGTLYKGEVTGCAEYRNGTLAADAFRRAADRGEPEGLRQLYILHHFGGAVPRNEDLAGRILAEALGKGQDWALAADIDRDARAGTPAAIQKLRVQAQGGNCHAQQALAQYYRTGNLSGTRFLADPSAHLATALFWARAAISAAATESGKAYWDAYGIAKAPCPSASLGDWSEVEAYLGPQLTAAATDAAGYWTVGSPEPAFPPPKAKAPFKPAMASGTASGNAVVNLAISLPKRVNSRSAAPDAATVFQTLDPSVWVVKAAASAFDLGRGIGKQGSAIAISPDTLLTNCHVVMSMKAIVIRHGNRSTGATVTAANPEKDRCVLRTEGQTLKPVRAIRGYGGLRVGEKVYAVGSPSGLENTLSEGIISGLRHQDGQNYVQTSAPISPGSSGGGLFDAAGNLIAVTTFTLRNTQSLNFAIAVEEFGR